MLEHLRIEHLILIEEAEIAFGTGLNILTGETGSGKSAILAAIRLLCGEKADPNLIRNGSDIAIVTGRIRFPASLDSLCYEEDLEPPTPNAVSVIRREIFRSGKSRAFFNDQQVGVLVLRKLLSHAIELVEQDSAYELSSRKHQLAWVDLWAGVDLKSFSKAYHATSALSQEWNRLVEERSRSQLELIQAEMELAEIEEALSLGDEDKLTQEHHRLSLAVLHGETLDRIHQALSTGAISSELSRHSQSLFSLSQEASELLKTASLEVKEAERIVHRLFDQLEFDPKRLEAIERSIAIIEKAKRKFPKGLAYHATALKAKIASLGELEEHEQALKNRREIAAKNLAESAASLTSLRTDAANELQELLTEELRSLNLPHARVEVRIHSREIREEGSDEISIFFTANPGQPFFPLEECASGGERARVLFALKILFAEKERQGCLIFDEIDSNIGGKTASILGQKLQRLATFRQVVCITHFVQVARAAAHHFLVSKISNLGETRTLVERLSETLRSKEYARMIGNET